MRLIAAIAADDDLVLHDERRGSDVAAALFRIIDADFPDLAAALLIERDHEVVLRAKEDLAIADGDTAILDEIGMTAGNAGPGCGIPVLPDHAAGGRIERVDLSARRDEVHHTINNDGRGVEILRVVACLKDPGREEIPDVGGIDLIESTVAPRELRAAVVQPVGARRAVVLRVKRQCHKQDQKESHKGHSLALHCSGGHRPPLQSFISPREPCATVCAESSDRDSPRGTQTTRRSPRSSSYRAPGSGHRHPYSSGACAYCTRSGPGRS